MAPVGVVPVKCLIIPSLFVGVLWRDRDKLDPLERALRCGYSGYPIIIQS